jgi:hypothetical protein
MPSEFDANLALALGNGAAALVAAGASGYMATAHCLAAPVREWRLAGVPLYALMSADRRGGASVALIRPSTVDLRSPSFRRFALIRERLKVAGIYCNPNPNPDPDPDPDPDPEPNPDPTLKVADVYCNPGPMQLFGALAQGPSPGRLVAQSGRSQDLREIEAICAELGSACWPGCHADVLKTTLAGLRATRTMLQVLHEREAFDAATPLGNHVHISQLSAEQIARRDN